MCVGGPNSQKQEEEEIHCPWKHVPHFKSPLLNVHTDASFRSFRPSDLSPSFVPFIHPSWGLSPVRRKGRKSWRRVSTLSSSSSWFGCLHVVHSAVVRTYPTHPLVFLPLLLLPNPRILSTGTKLYPAVEDLLFLFLGAFLPFTLFLFLSHTLVFSRRHFRPDGRTDARAPHSHRKYKRRRERGELIDAQLFIYASVGVVGL